MCLIFCWIVLLPVGAVFSEYSPPSPTPDASSFPSYQEPVLPTLEKKISVQFELIGAQLGSEPGSEPSARVYTARKCRQVSLAAVRLTNNEEETKKVFSDSMFKISRSDSKSVYDYRVALFDFLSGEILQESGSQTVTKTAKIVCPRSYGSLPAGSYVKQIVVANGRETQSYYELATGRKISEPALSVLRGAFNNPTNYRCVGGKVEEAEQSSGKVWRDWPSRASITVKLNDDRSRISLNQPWIAENDATIRADSDEFGIHKEVQLKVLSNAYAGAGVFNLCEGDSVKIGGAEFQATDFSEGGVWLEEKSGKRVMLVSKSPDASLYSVSLRLIQSKRISGKSTNPFQAKVEFSFQGEPEATETISNPEPTEQTRSPEATPVDKKRVAETEVRCKKKVAVSYKLVFPLFSPCPNGFATESVENFGGIVVFYRRANCFKEYVVCSAKPVCDSGDETIETTSSPCFYEAPLAELGKP
ncbi:MAG: hypothetical protein V1817_00720 [Candidatus Micrarchaeota archaeon]